MKFYLYSGTGNNFLAIDGRNVNCDRFRQKRWTSHLCACFGTDGMMILSESDKADFRMEFYNSDGSGGMFCGNGGRCIVAFADLVGVKPFHTTDWVFEAPDGIHRATILSHLGETKLIRLGMHDVEAPPVKVAGGLFIDTGARHLVRFVPDVREVDVVKEGAEYRKLPEFAPEGVNVDFVSVAEDGRVQVRTYEKGVEAETASCGTGVTASVLAASSLGIAHSPCKVSTEGGELTVEFKRTAGGGFSDIYLTGPTLCQGDLVE